VEVLLQAYNKKAGLKIKRIFDNKSHTVKDTDMIDTGRALSSKEIYKKDNQIYSQLLTLLKVVFMLEMWSMSFCLVILHSEVFPHFYYFTKYDISIAYANTFTNSVRNNQIKIFANQLFGENELDQLLKSFEEFKGKESMVMKQFQNVLAPLILRLLDKFKGREFFKHNSELNYEIKMLTECIDYYHGLKIRKAMKRQKSIVSYYRICEENQEDYDKKLLQDPIFGDLRLLHQNYFDKIVNPSRKSSSNSEIVKSNKLRYSHYQLVLIPYSMNSKQKSLYKLNLNIESALHQDLDQATKSLALNKSKSVVTTNVVRDILFKVMYIGLRFRHSDPDWLEIIQKVSSCILYTIQPPCC